METPTDQRPPHPYEDEYTHEWAWRYDDLYTGFAQHDFVGFARRVTGMGANLAKAGMTEAARGWTHFVSRKLTETGDRK